MLNLPTPILHILKPSFQTPQRTLSDGFTSPSHLDILAYVPSLPQNALIKVTKSLLIIRSKEKKSVFILLEFSTAFDSVDYFLLETLHYLGFHGNPLS